MWARSVVRAEPDGLTIGFSTSGPLAVNKILNAELGYDPEKDLQPIGVVAVLPNIVVVSAELPIDSLTRLIDYLKKTPDVGYGSVGPGSSQHLAGAFFEQLIGARMTHVPYRVTGNLVTDLVSGRVPVSFQLLPNVLGSIQGAKVRPLAVAAKSRLAALPNVPTAAEAGLPEYESAAWFALIAPRGIPRAYVDRLNADVNVALRDPAVRSRFSDLGAEPRESSPEDMTRVMADDIAKWGRSSRKAVFRLPSRPPTGHSSEQPGNAAGRDPEGKQQTGAVDCPGRFARHLLGTVWHELHEQGSHQAAGDRGEAAHDDADQE